MSEKKLVKVMFCVPNEGHTLPEAYDNRLVFASHIGILQMASKLGIKEIDGQKLSYPDDVEFQFSWGTVGRVLTPLARERLTEWAIQGGMDYMCMIDDDMIIPVDMFERLYRHGVDIVAALAFSRNPPHFPVIYRVDEGYDPLKAQEYYITRRVENYPKNILLECDAVGFGAVLINMNVVRRMAKPWFMSTTESGEDIWFCKKAREVGARVFMDTALKLGHLGYPPIITEEDFERTNDNAKFRETFGEWQKTPVGAK